MNELMLSHPNHPDPQRSWTDRCRCAFALILYIYGTQDLLVLLLLYSLSNFTAVMCCTHTTNTHTHTDVFIGPLLRLTCCLCASASSAVCVFFHVSLIITHTSLLVLCWSCRGLIFLAHFFSLRAFCCPTLSWSFGHHMPRAGWWAFPECCNFFLKECLEFSACCQGGANMGPEGFGHTHGLMAHMF